MAVLRPGQTTTVTTPLRTPLARLVTARATRPTLTPRVVGRAAGVAAPAPTTVLTPRPGQTTSGSGTGGGTVIGGAIRYVQASPAATWSWTHPLGRLPQVDVFVRDPDTGRLENVDVDLTEQTTTTITITWPEPMAGELLVS